ncbi:MAG: hypothetical protein QF405_12885 [Roseibacillus sp.]|jgi:hypothetical protein|nr:hypothetical protein [Roseibacillus sp.]MDP7308527.1 hypothetical protein [Roseibacillus sp.]HJM62834.1 hypothetical protein [Roseibacillus sp.]|tara:strand:+ start:8091 stop:9452 length:1362 start_codon:yes stop_codon:yes gene_type:complete
MNKSTIVHLGWGLVAVLAFLAGYFILPSGRDDAGVAARRGNSGPGSGAQDGISNGKADSAAGESATGSKSIEKDEVARMLAEKITLSEADIGELGQTFRKSSDPVAKRLAFSKLIQGLTADNALLIREQIEHKDHRSAEFQEFHYAWGAVAGVDAVIFGVDTEEDDMKPALAGWAGASPQEAMAWIEGLNMENDARFDPLLKERKLEVTGLRHHLMSGIVDGLADADPRQAAMFVERMVAEGQADPGHMHIVTGEVLRAAENPLEASSWAEGLPEGRMRNEALGRIADHFAEREPAEAAQWAQGFAGQPGTERIFWEVGANWAGRDPQAALEWVNDLPEGQSQQIGIRGSLNSWARRDPTAAGEYLQEMAPSPMRDAAVAGYSTRVAWEDPAAAMSWAESIAEPERRQEAMVEVGRAWRHRGGQGLQEWLSGSNLPAEIQENILTPRDRRRRD